MPDYSELYNAAEAWLKVRTLYAIEVSKALGFEGKHVCVTTVTPNWCVVAFDLLDCLDSAEEFAEYFTQICANFELEGPWPEKLRDLRVTRVVVNYNGEAILVADDKEGKLVLAPLDQGVNGELNNISLKASREELCSFFRKFWSDD